jgi:peptidoglycan hydrolase-like protein with peptidoglycan-binding domain
MIARRTGLRAAIVGLLTSAIVVGVSVGTASACPAGTQRSDAFAETLPQVRPGNSGTAVLGLQLALRDQGYPLRGTGYYGPLTLGSVKSFQRKHGITTSGIVGSKTWHALVGSLPTTMTGNGGVQEPTRGLQPGSNDQDLRNELTFRLSRIFPYDQGNLPTSSSYDEKWQALARDFQRRNGINPSGVIGPKTWHALTQVVSMEGHWGC